MAITLNGTTGITLPDSGSTLSTAGGTVTGALTLPTIVLPSGGSLAVKDSSNVDTYIGVDSAGRVTMPYQPAFSANKTSAVAQGGGTYTNWELVHVNIGNHFNPTTGVFTAPVAGQYCFTHSYINAGTGYVNMFLYKNGSLVIGSGARPANTVYDQATKTFIISLAANDTIVIADALGSTNGTFSDSNAWTQFCGHLIG